MTDTKTAESTTPAPAKDNLSQTQQLPPTSTSSYSYSYSYSLIAAHVFCFVLSFVIIRSFWEFEDASKAMAFYGVYHRYGWNQVVHFFGVPGLLWSLLIFMVHIPLPFVNDNDQSSSSSSSFSSLNYASFLAICYNLFYLSIDRLGAILFAPIIYGMYVSAVRMMERDQNEAAAAVVATSRKQIIAPAWYGTGKTLKFAAIVHVLCWYVQIHLGHKIIEGAQPAVLQSLGGALSVAPLFAFYEGLWLLGINQELQETTKLLVEEYTKEICAAAAASGGEGAMKACGSLL